MMCVLANWLEGRPVVGACCCLVQQGIWLFSQSVDEGGDRGIVSHVVWGCLF